MRAPLAIDLFCGLGGWTEGLLAEGYYVVGFDIERHEYGDAKYPAQLVIQDVLTLHGSQFKDAALIVASPPCQAYSYRAMPWSRAKALPPPDNSLFEACFRIQREAIEAAGHHIPMVVENVRGAQKWVGRSRWNYGSFHLWGDVPALMPIAKRAIKVAGLNWSGSDKPGYVARAFNTTAEQRMHDAELLNEHDSRDCEGLGRQGSRRAGPSRRQDLAVVSEPCGGHMQAMHEDGRKGIPHAPAGHWTNPTGGIKQHKSGRAWFADPDSISGSTSSKSKARKAGSAHIAKIPLPLSRYIGRTFWPLEVAA